MRILFVTSNRIGDAVLSTGLLDHLLRAHPEASFTIVCGPAASGVFERMPHCERVIAVEKRRFSRHWLTVWAATVETRWDLVIDLRSAALAYALPARRRVVLQRHPRQSLGDKPRENKPRENKPRENKLGPHKIAELAALLGLDEAPLPVAWTGPAEEARAARLMPQGCPVICLGPTANWAPKTWPAERFVALFQALRAGPLPGARPMVMAGPGEYERELARPVIEALDGTIDAVGTLTLAEAVACLRRGALFVGNDSGLMHLAASTGAPTLGLYGPTAALIRRYSPAGLRTGYVVARGPAMTDLPVEDALAAAIGVLAPYRAAA